MFTNSDKEKILTTPPATPAMVKVELKKGRAAKKRSVGDAAEDVSSQSAKVCKR